MSAVASGYLAAELVDPAFAPLAMPAALRLLRSLLFGSDPDRHMINYRCRQLLTLVHASPLAPFVAALDPRLTYASGGADETLAADTAFVPSVNTPPKAPATLVISGSPSAPDQDGRVARQYLVQIETPSTVSVRQDHPFQIPVFEFTLTDSLSNFVPLGQSGYTCAVRTTLPGALWEVNVRNRPQADLGQLASRLLLLGSQVFDYVFGPDLNEPWATFRSSWESDPDLPARLAGLLLGIVYRTELIRRGLS